MTDASSKTEASRATAAAETDTAPPAAAAPAPAPTGPAAKPARRSRLRAILFLLVPVLAVAGGGALWLRGGRFVSTDNAYVGAQKVLVTPEVSGRVTRIAVQEGQRVKVGDDLFEIDPAPYRIAVEQAEAKIAQVRTDLGTLKTTLHSLDRQIELAQQALQLRQADVSRKSELLGNRSGSRADVDAAELTVAAARTQLELLQQQRATALNQLRGNPDLPVEEYPPFMEASAALDKAHRDLSLTKLTAPIEGTATQVSSIQMGRYLASGAAVFSIVADDKPWVDANPKETDLTYVKAGQEATITVDAYPDRVWHGRVASISPGTGAQFSILPAQNASGNWVKVVQRVPVRIEIDPAEAARAAWLRAGLSVTAEVDTRGAGSHVYGMFGSLLHSIGLR